MPHGKFSFKIKTKLTFNLLGWLIYYSMLVIMLTLVFLHGKSMYRTDWPIFGSFITYDHISNFVGSYIFLTGISLIWVLNKVSWKYILAASAIIVLANFIYEYLLTFLNTKDPLDALAGVIGVCFGLLVLVLLSKFGVKKYEQN